jgi:hypothetical protein
MTPRKLRLMPRLDRIAVAVAGALFMAGCAVAPQNPGTSRFMEPYTDSGIALAVQRRYGEAIRQFQAAVIAAPHAAYAYNNLGYAYLLSGANQQAVEALEEARRLDPGHEKARANLRIAQAKLAAASAITPSPQSVRPAVPPATESVGGLSLVEVGPQVFELKGPVNYRKAEPATRSFKLEVANGNGVAGLAKRIARRLEGAGVRTARITNQRPFAQARTEVQYREGYAAQAAELAGKLEHPARLVPSERLGRDVDVRLVLGKDLPRQALERSSRRSRA